MDFILYEQNGSVATITINREKALNALNSVVLEELDKTLDAVNLEEVRCLILTGAGQKYQRNADRRINRSMPIRIHGRTGDAVFSSSSRTTDLISQASKKGT